MTKAFSKICDFDNGEADNPDEPAEGSRYTMGNVMKSERLVGSDQEKMSNIDGALKLTITRLESCHSRLKIEPIESITPRYKKRCR
jgi:hypothetical protein